MNTKTINMLKLLLYLIRIIEKALKEEFKDDSIVLSLQINNDKVGNIIPNMKET